MEGLQTVSRALNDGDTARAQIATLLLCIPDPPSLSKSIDSPGELIRFICNLSWSGIIKYNWDPTKHPRWPAGAPDHQGGQFSPKTAEENNDCNSTWTRRRGWMRHYGKDWPMDPKRPGRYQDAAHIKARADGGGDEPTNIKPLPHDEHVKEHMENKDFSRWAKRPSIARALRGAIAQPQPPNPRSPPVQNPSPKAAPTLEEQVPLDELLLEDPPIIPE